MTDLPLLSADAEPDTVWAAIDGIGGVILEGLVAPDLLGRIRDEVAPFAAALLLERSDAR